MKKISIIIPHYNTWDMLAELLASIPNSQTFQIIVIDDHSKDYDMNKLKIKDKFPQVIIQQNSSDKKGAGAARNKGLTLATGDWLLFADSDDLFTENLTASVTKYIDSSYDIVYFKPNSFTDNISKISNRHKRYVEYIENYITDKTKYNELKLRYYFVVPWSKLIKHEIVKKNKIHFEEVMVSNDILFSAKIGFYAETIIGESDTIYTVRERKDSLTNVVGNKRFIERFRAWLDYASFLKDSLNNHDFKLISLTALPYLIYVLKNKLGLKAFMTVLKESQKSGIPVFDGRVLNPIFLFKSIRKNHKHNAVVEKTKSDG